MFPRRGQGSGIIIGPAEPIRTRKESLTRNTASGTKCTSQASIFLDYSGIQPNKSLDSHYLCESVTSIK